MYISAPAASHPLDQEDSRWYVVTRGLETGIFRGW